MGAVENEPSAVAGVEADVAAVGGEGEGAVDGAAAGEVDGDIGLEGAVGAPTGEALRIFDVADEAGLAEMRAGGGGAGGEEEEKIEDGASGMENATHGRR